MTGYRKSAHRSMRRVRGILRRSVVSALAFSLLAACSPAREDPVRHSYTASGGAELSYLASGDGPTVVLFHGLTSSAQSNYFGTPIADALRDAGFRVIATDLRGHGSSAVANTAENWPVDVLAQDAALLIASLEEPPVAVVGYSLGALVSLRLQATGGFDAPALALGGMGDMTAVIGDRRRHDGLDALLKSVAADERGELQDRVRLMLAASGSRADSVRGSLRHRMTVSKADLAAMDMPVLVLNGEDDFDNGDGSVLATMMPNAHFQTVPGDHLSAPQSRAYADTLADWLVYTTR